MRVLIKLFLKSYALLGRPFPHPEQLPKSLGTYKMGFFFYREHDTSSLSYFFLIYRMTILANDLSSYPIFLNHL